MSYFSVVFCLHPKIFVLANPYYMLHPVSSLCDRGRNRFQSLFLLHLSIVQFHTGQPLEDS